MVNDAYPVRWTGRQAVIALPEHIDVSNAAGTPAAPKTRKPGGYVTGMWGKWHLGSDPENRGPANFGFDEAVWYPRTADEVLWTMQFHFPDGEVTATPYAGATKIPLEPQPAARQSQAIDSSTSHMGFRCIMRGTGSGPG